MEQTSRHVFVQIVTRTELRTWDQRAEHEVPARGEVQEASYLARSSDASDWLRRFLRRPARDTLQLLPPFDENGMDVHTLFDTSVPIADGTDGDLGQVRRITGTVVALEPRREGDRVALRDGWILDAPAARIVEMFDFGVREDDGDVPIVCCAMAPLVIAKPTTMPVSALAATVEARASRIAGRELVRPDDTVACVVEVREGDRVEVLGLVTDLRATKRFDLGGRGMPYRDGAPPRRSVVVGDEPGLRLVIRTVGRG